MAENGAPGAGTPAANGIQTGGNGADAALNSAAKKPVVYGKNADAYLAKLEAQKAEQPEQAESEIAEPENDDKIFDEQIRPKYKAQIKKLVGDGVKKALEERFKNDTSKQDLQAANERWDKIAPMIEAARKKYGTEEGDIDGLVAKYLADDDVYSDRAIEQGTSVDAVRKNDERDNELKRIQTENRRMKAEKEAEKREAQTREIIGRWRSDAEELKKAYPDFDFDVEMKNERFRRFLSEGETVKDAFEFVHKDEIYKSLGNKVASETERRIINGIAANARRPAEGAAMSQSSVIESTDLTKMSRAQRAELIRRAQSGEKITFTRKG